MEIGNEISQKIRSAIKAKLVDLGAYVDDELPDYIMVMVANKKTKAQMTEDLNLFLGIHTDKFTSWLHNLLCKLQSITADIDTAKEDHGEPTKEEIDLLVSADTTRKAEEASKEQDNNKDVDESKTVASVSKDNSQSQLKDECSNNKGNSQLKDRVKSKSSSGGTKERKRSRGSESGKNEVAAASAPPEKVGRKQHSLSNKEDVTQPQVTDVQEIESTGTGDVAVEEEDEPEIHLRPEHDEFEEEIPQDNDNKNSNKSASDTVTAHKKASSSSSKTEDSREVKEASRKDIEDDSLDGVVKDALLQTYERTVRQVSPKRSIKRKSSETHDKTSLDERPSIASRLGKKHRSLSSRVGAVIKHDVYDSEDEYDPFKPSIGNVASVVKVTERKSSIPAAMQPNKSLLFKAVKDAHKSIESASQKHAEKTDKPSHAHYKAAVVKPMVRHYRDDTEPSRSLKDRLGAQKKQSLSSRLASSRSIELVSKSSRENQRLFRRRSAEGKLHDEQIKRKRRRSDDTKEKRRRLSTEEYVPTSTSYKDSVEQYTPTPTDSRQVKIVKKITNQSKAHRDVIEEDILDTLIQSGADDSEFTDVGDVQVETGSPTSSRRSSKSEESVLDRRYSILQKKSTKDELSGSKKSNPKFVVTLDGIDPKLLQKETSSPEMPPIVTKNVVLVKPQRAHINPVMINLSEDDHEDRDSNSRNIPTPEPMDISLDSEPQKIQEKCRFWPACKTGQLCPYIHPTTECMKFPNCYFGDKCLYLHPACKFDTTCTRPDCPYTHTIKKRIAPAVPSFVIQPVRVPVYVPRPPAVQLAAPRAPNPLEQNCKFFPNCTNMNCTFRHPKPCRYGISCTNKATCYFYHPSLPSKSQLKWTPSKQAGAKDSEVKSVT